MPRKLDGGDERIVRPRYGLVETGKPAPDFELEADDGSTVRLSELRGRPVVLYFYPRDDAPATSCSKQRREPVMAWEEEELSKIQFTLTYLYEADEAFRRLMTLADDKLIREIGGLHTADLKKLVLGRVLAESQEPPRDEPPSEPMVAAR